MPSPKYAAYEGAAPYFNLVRGALGDLVDGEHFFDIVADDVVYEVLYDFPGWPRVIRGRADLMAQFRGYVDNIAVQSADRLIAHKTDVSSSSNTRSTGGSSRPAPTTTTGSARSSGLKTGKSRTGETTWTLSRPGTH
jgi:hypothetical protein